VDIGTRPRKRRGHRRPPDDGYLPRRNEPQAGEEGRELLAGEMSHRVKNLLGIASGLTQMTSRSSSSIADMTSQLTGAHSSRPCPRPGKTVAGPAGESRVNRRAHHHSSRSLRRDSGVLRPYPGGGTTDGCGRRGGDGSRPGHPRTRHQLARTVRISFLNESCLRINFNFALREARSEFVGTTTSSRRNICGQRGNPTSAWRRKREKMSIVLVEPGLRGDRVCISMICL